MVVFFFFKKLELYPLLVLFGCLFFFFAYKFLSFDLSLWFYFIVVASKSQTNLVAGSSSP